MGYSTGDGADYQARLRTDYHPYATRAEVQVVPASPNDASNYWTVDVCFAANYGYYVPTNTSIFTFDTILDVDAQWNDHAGCSGHTGSYDAVITFYHAKTGSPGALYWQYTVYYRLIVT